MRVSAVLRRLTGVPVAVALVAGLLYGTATPARADPPTLTLAESCGVATLSWETGTIGGDESWATRVRRNDVVIDRFEMRDRGSRRYGAADGDVLVVERDGLPERRFRFTAPDGCTDTPRLAVTAVAECYGVELRVENGGDATVTGLRLLSPAHPTPEEVAPVEPGAATVIRRLADGDNYLLVQGEPGPELVVWFSGTYRLPAGCGPEAVTATVTDACAGARIVLANRAEGAVRIRVSVNGVTLRNRVVSAGVRDEFTVPAEPGAVVAVADADLGGELARHTVATVTCESPSPSAAPSATPPTGAGAGGDGGSDGAGGSGGDGLPVTGVPALVLVVSGLLVVGAGTALLVSARRRRTRFTADG